MSQKRIWTRAFLGLFAALAGAAVIVFLFFPGILLQMVRWQYASAAHMTRKVVTVDGVTMPYYEGGKGETLVLIHGFGDSKISFLQAGRYLTHRFHVIMPDVPGFGETTKQTKANYGVSHQVKRFHAFFNKLGLKRFHLGGNSMGGHISAGYALTYPNRVKKLLLLNAAGLKVPDNTTYKHSKHPIRNRAEFEVYLKTLFVKRPTIPGPFITHFIKRSKKNFAMRNKIAADLRSDSMRHLNKRISSLQHPTLVLWGDTDKVVTIRIGRLFHKLLPRSRWVLMKKCGHTPQYERPRETAQHIISHLLKSPPPLRRLPAPRKAVPQKVPPTQKTPRPTTPKTPASAR